MFLETARLEREDWQEERLERALTRTADRVIIITAEGVECGVRGIETDEDEGDDLYV